MPVEVKTIDAIMYDPPRVKKKIVYLKFEQTLRIQCKWYTYISRENPYKKVKIVHLRMKLLSE